MKKDCLLFHSDWLDVFCNEQKYIYAQRKNKDSVAILCFKKVHGQYFFLMHYQSLIGIEEPDTLFPCPITGTLETHLTVFQVALQEVNEEAGINLPQTITPVVTTKFVSTTQMNETVHCFLFNVSGFEQTKPKTDGSYYEKISYNKWLTLPELKTVLKQQTTLSSLWVLYSLFENWRERTHEN